MSRTRLEFVPDFSRYPTARLQARNVGLVALDLDNLVSKYHSWKVLERPARKIDEIRELGVNVCLLTNEKNRARVEHISSQLGGLPFVHKGMDGMPGKPNPAMLDWATQEVGFGELGDKAMMFDDQIKTYFGAKKAGFSYYGWTFPEGFNQHLGVMAARPIEVPVGFGLIAAQRVAELLIIQEEQKPLAR